MKTLVIYDDKGLVFSQSTGDYKKPEGINYIETSIPEGKVLVGVDTINKTPILEDLPKSEMELLKQKLEETEEAINFLIMGGF